MKFRYLLLFSLFFAAFFTSCSIEQDTQQKEHYESPKLVIGIMVDQMRYDYIYRYWDKYGDDGIKRLVNEGFSFDNARFDYMPTYTGPGHASVYTGTTPAVHGIIGNSWYVKDEDRTTYVTDDPDVTGVGTDSDEGKMSPRWLLSSTITDELMMHSNMRSKVVGLALKDRGSILPAGHIGDAYWFDYGNAKMISSTFYMEELPAWVQEFNARNLPAQYLSEPWETLLPIEEYTESIDDDNDYEGTFEGQERPVFPHDLPSYAEIDGNGIVSYTPYGNTYTFEFLYAAIEGEQLGQDEYTDFAAVSFSSPDHMGHRYAPPSKEIQDTYLRFDREIAQLLNYIDAEFGKENVLVFLTSDHGGGHNARYLEDLNVPTGRFIRNSVSDALSERLVDIYGFDPVKSFRAIEVYLDHEMIRANGERLEDVQTDVANFLIEQEGVAGAITTDALRNNSFTEPLQKNIHRGYNASRSGDVMYWLDPQWFAGNQGTGTTHGSPYGYDTRAPLLWYGYDVPAGSSTESVFISDIASTLANFLNIPYTSGNTGNPMNNVIYNR